MVIDWFAFTVPTVNPSEVAKILGLEPEDFADFDRGGMGYKKRRQFGHITIYYDGAENMGTHVEMSGQGCREWETHHSSRYTWPNLISTVLLAKGHFSRLDIAIDTVDGSLSLSDIEAAYAAGNIRTSFRRSGCITSDYLGPDQPLAAGFTRYFGSSSSRTVFRIYDKQLQMGTESPWVSIGIEN